MTLVESHFLMQETWRNILIKFIMVKKATNVTHVESHFPNHQTWRHTLIQFIMVKKITNVTGVKRCFLWHHIWLDTLMQFIIVKKIKKKTEQNKLNHKITPSRHSISDTLTSRFWSSIRHNLDIIGRVSMYGSRMATILTRTFLANS